MYPDTASEFTSKFKRVWILDYNVYKSYAIAHWYSSLHPPPQQLTCETEHALNRPASRSMHYQWHSPKEACVTNDTLQMKRALPVTLSKRSMCYQWHSPNEACITSDTLQKKHVLPVTFSKWSKCYQWHSSNEACVTVTLSKWSMCYQKHVLPMTLSKWSMCYQWHSPNEACVTGDTLQIKHALPVTLPK